MDDTAMKYTEGSKDSLEALKSVAADAGRLLAAIVAVAEKQSPGVTDSFTEKFKNREADIEFRIRFDCERAQEAMFLLAEGENKTLLFDLISHYGTGTCVSIQ